MLIFIMKYLYMVIYIVIVFFTSSIIVVTITNNTNEMLLTAGFAQKQEIDSDNIVYDQDTFSAIG